MSRERIEGSVNIITGKQDLPMYTQDQVQGLDISESITKAFAKYGQEVTVTGKTQGPAADIYTVITEDPVEKQKKILEYIRHKTGQDGVYIETTDIPDTVRVIAPHKTSAVMWTDAYTEETLAQYKAGGDIIAPIGLDAYGKPIILNISKAPHVLIAGATGSGKSVTINNIIAGVILSDCDVIVIDAKGVDFQAWGDNIKYITDITAGIDALEEAAEEMDDIYKNNYEPLKKVIIIDEWADMVMSTTKDDRERLETATGRLLQKARAADIHLIISTQRPSTNIITGVLKANLTTRIALKVRSATDSRVILDAKGAERLAGAGALLIQQGAGAAITWGQGGYISAQDMQEANDWNRYETPGRLSYLDYMIKKLHLR